MKINIPNWASKRRITVLAGIESVIKRENGIWYEKTSRCIRCGKCCMNVPKKWSQGQGKNGHCQYLMYEANEYFCDKASGKPYRCCVGDGLGRVDDCNIEWTRIK